MTTAIWRENKSRFAKNSKPASARSGRDNPKRGAPMRGSVTKGRVEPTAATRYAVYSGQERLGAYGRAGDAWVALDRLGREIGVFDSEQAAIAAIDSGAAP